MGARMFFRRNSGYLMQRAWTRHGSHGQRDLFIRQFHWERDVRPQCKLKGYGLVVEPHSSYRTPAAYSNCLYSPASILISSELGSLEFAL